MEQLTNKFIRLKTSIGGNREKRKFEDTFGMPKEEQAYITMPNRANLRIISELEFALNLSDANDNTFAPVLEEALNYLLACIEKNGALTNQNCEKAEEILEPLQDKAKEYEIILAAHAHIDMNWMWSYQETVSIVLATFRSILNIMNQYPDFYFSQSQASVYKIVEEYDSELMEEIKARIAEGRWEVTASSWVETDKNMPSTESLLRHIQYTKEYLSKVWNVKDVEVDFSPDTFGHNINIPEIDQAGNVKYLYHCRGLKDNHVLYRYIAPSGKEVLAYKEPYWYNSAITPHMGAGIIDISKRCAGLKTGLIVYGVGDHGGGPTRRDVERAMDMMTWRIYPKIKFGTIHEFFHKAEAVREKLPIVKEELNFFAPGCYTTQSRIKRGNRRTENALVEADAMSVIAGNFVDFTYQKSKLRKAWQDVLFTHFHDILTGSCVQDSREYAMALYQASIATANTQIQNAMRKIGEKIDTSSIKVDVDHYSSQSEGAGAGYGIENFVGVPSTERGTGKTRIFHVFNSLPKKRNEVVTLTVWDWVGNLQNVEVHDTNGKQLDCQLVDENLQQYWDHKYFRIYVNVTVPATGYTTIVLNEKIPDNYPHYFQNNERVCRLHDSFVLDNGNIKAVISSNSGRIESLKVQGEEMIAKGKTAGLSLIETETISSSAWEIGRYLKDIPVDRCIKIERIADGDVCQTIKATYLIMSSTVEVLYSLYENAKAVQMEYKIDWHEIGGETIPLLAYSVPYSYETEEYLYDIPGGAIIRKAMHSDVPALQYGMAINKKGQSIVLMSDSKYGYRGADNKLILSLINSSTSPDLYPERGIHNITLWLGACLKQEKEVEELADEFNNKLFYQPSNCHKGILPLEKSLFDLQSDSVIISGILPSEDGGIILRMYEVAGQKGMAKLSFDKTVRKAAIVDLYENELEKAEVNGTEVTVEVEPKCICNVKVVI